MPSMIFHSADVAEEMGKAGLGIRTPNAVRAAVAEGRLYPDLKSPRGVSAWSAQALWEDLQRQARARALRHLAASSLRRLGPAREPVQTELRIPAGEK